MIKRLQVLQTVLVDLELVTKQLQSPNITFSQMRILFDTVVVEYPTMKQFIGNDCHIVHSVYFESALQKISAHQQHTLNLQEKLSVQKLKSLYEMEPIPVLDDSSENGQSIIQKAQAQL